MSGRAGIGAARSRGPVHGDATAEPIKGASFKCRSMRVTGGQIPEGPSSAPRRAPVSGDATREGRRASDRLVVDAAMIAKEEAA